ncbi:MAG: hypothetical protein KAT77_04555 [Nanoarchaeota archaeon]|nr:hypothetical protein [Nanoarchaeota archaeon]
MLAYLLNLLKSTGHWTSADERFKNLVDMTIFMKQIKKHPTKKWEVSIMEFEDEEGQKFKVTRRLPDASVAETKVFKNKEEAKKLFDNWLNYLIKF